LSGSGLPSSVKGTTMHRKLLLAALVLLLALSPLFSEARLSYEPYGEDEFPIWTMELRRAECIFFGSLVITFPVASLICNVLENEGLIDRPDESFDRMLQTAAVASALSFTITTADYVLGKLEER